MGTVTIDYFGLGVSLMCASAAETVFDRELRAIMDREAYSNPPAAIPPVPGAVAPILGAEDEIERARMAA